MERLSERWFRNIEKITNTIFSFIFFWSILGYLAGFEWRLYYYIGHLKHVTGNHGYFVLQVVVAIVNLAVNLVLFFSPLYITGVIFHLNKAGKYTQR
jgi:hypothetical protein